jgi:hypothetical protein
MEASFKFWAKFIFRHFLMFEEQCQNVYEGKGAQCFDEGVRCFGGED